MSTTPAPAKRALLRSDRPDRADLMPSGTYELLIEQELKLRGEKDATPADQSGTIMPQLVSIEVRLERFLPPEILFRYPQPDSTSNFSNVIPHLVLGKPQLPWERTVSSQIKTAAPPVGPKETALPWLALLAFEANESLPVISTSVEELKIAIAPWEAGRQCRTIEVPWEMFCGMAPLRDELNALAHVQQPAMLGQTITADGRMTAHLLNCLPVKSLLDPAVKKNADGTTATRTIEVHLVSLETEGVTLPTAQERKTRPTSKPPVRLLSLDHWRFTHDPKITLPPDGAEFARLCEKIKPRRFRPEGMDVPASQGYVLFHSKKAQGAPKPLYYRSPLLPVKDETPPEGLSWNAAAAGFFELSGHGIDISLASAWQMGRLVSMGDPKLGQEFARIREDWRYQEAIATRASTTWKDDALAKVSTDRISQVKKGQETAKQRLRDLWLLQGVPPHYLIPRADMLPRETISVVHLDRRWADAWCFGAFSAGSYSPRDKSLESPAAEELTSLLKPSRNAGVMGVLIRSQIIMMWPELRAHFFQGTTALAEEKVLQQRKVTPDTWLVLVEGAFTRVKLSLPAEAQSYEVKAGEAFATSDNLGGAKLAELRMKQTPGADFPLTLT